MKTVRVVRAERLAIIDLTPVLADRVAELANSQFDVLDVRAEVTIRASEPKVTMAAIRSSHFKIVFTADDYYCPIVQPWRYIREVDPSATVISLMTVDDASSERMVVTSECNVYRVSDIDALLLALAHARRVHHLYYLEALPANFWDEMFELVVREISNLVEHQFDFSGAHPLPREIPDPRMVYPISDGIEFLRAEASDSADSNEALKSEGVEVPATGCDEDDDVDEVSSNRDGIEEFTYACINKDVYHLVVRGKFQDLRRYVDYYDEPVETGRWSLESGKPMGSCEDYVSSVPEQVRDWVIDRSSL